MSSQLVNSGSSFVVFADTTPKAQPSRSKKPLQQSTHTHHDKQRASLGCAVLQELNTNKSFVLSPKSQINAEKENFDPIKKQIVAYRHTKSQLQPLSERAGSHKHNRDCVLSAAASAPTNMPKTAIPICKKPNASGNVDNLVLLLSDIDISDATPCRSSSKTTSTQLKQQQQQQQQQISAKSSAQTTSSPGNIKPTRP
ncbi:hypothetical protein IWW36_001165 [Coemansia brasiliensis]|uniref:Uncharacterized protein n=1 Tax=Coemansia brasiliensis TaxID=2650707 RepID=A0A9W8M142_9FUNG|nr:hypothetical protein IWW36_001165 [Coemansia brasiliensis]